MSHEEIVKALEPLKLKLERREHKNAVDRDRRRMAKLAKLGVKVEATALHHKNVKESAA